MSQIYVANGLSQLPNYPQHGSYAAASTVLNATGETVFMVGHVWLENPLGGTKTISAAGGGSIVWRTGAITFANGATVFDVGIQDVSATTAPSQGDGTFDVKASFTGGGGGVTASATQTSVMTAGTKTLAHGQMIAIGMAMTTAGGADSVAVISAGVAITTNLPCTTTNTSGSYVRTGWPCAYIVFDDSSIGWIWGGNFLYSSGNAFSVNVDTATADEYANIIIPTTTFRATGVRVSIDINVSATFEAILYSDPLGTPVAERTITIDGEQSGTANVNDAFLMFSSYYDMRPWTTYAVAIRPTTTNNLSVLYSDSIAGAVLLGAPNTYAYACRRIGNSGAFSDYNGGTAKTRLMNISLVSNYAEQGVNNANYRIGI